ncbi:MAG TPA: histidine kinase [Kineosporiaceae bacterium]
MTFRTTSSVSLDWAPINCSAGQTVPAALSGAVALLCALRRQFPRSALLAASALFAWYPATAAALIVTAYAAAGRLRRVRRLIPTLFLAVLLAVVPALIASHFQWLHVALTFGVDSLVCVVVPVLVRALLDQRDRLLGALRERAVYLEENNHLLAENLRLTDSGARLEERSRIAEEMHDVLGHRISLISLYAGALEVELAEECPRLGEEARLVRTTVHQAMDEVRTMLGLLRQNDRPLEGAPSAVGTWSDIAHLVEQSRAAGVSVDLDWAGPDLVGTAPAVQRAVHRVVREGLTNVHRHATGAVARVHVDRGPEAVRVTVRNTAPRDVAATASVPRGTGRGLVALQERVRLMAGHFDAGCRTDGGFELRVHLPLTYPSAIDDDGSGAPSPLASRTPLTGLRIRQKEPEPQARNAFGDRLSRVGMAGVLTTGLIGAVAVVTVGFNTVQFDLVTPPPPPFAEFASVLIGSQQGAVDTDFGRGQLIAEVAAHPVEPRKPSQTVCHYWYDNPHVNRTILFERLCFRNGVLVHKTQFSARAAAPRAGR